MTAKCARLRFIVASDSGDDNGDGLGGENAGAQDAVGVGDAHADFGAGGAGVEGDDRKLSVERVGAPVGAESGTRANDGRGFAAASQRAPWRCVV